ncbi:MoaF-related domain-containing protein [Dickeya solani]|uniref:MoaF-like domain-containing protein n=1 Tax=Dickeya solani TaxID=1089444 RepID=A0AAX4EX36_9GAMM|nr:hypothetical protein [Dickeya solani]MCA6998567.1 hypothetical protein [Dickeya solani]MCZ0822017.1 hypothetical protein [Dickeya solani]MDV6996346.1 hypothetical protein [Dickeya solani]MDV7005994.1 hypothetical protein [Dickeya solani]MDV7039373.1 hypothetical protein [Dickeya solani]
MSFKVLSKKFAGKVLLLTMLAGASLSVMAASQDPHAVAVASDAEFVAVGKSYNVDFGDQKFRLDFKSAKEMVFTSPDGKNTANVDITVTPIGNDVYMIYWSRRAGQHVVHVDDFRNGVAYTNIFLPDGSASRRKGTLVEIK